MLEYFQPQTLARCKTSQRHFPRYSSHQQVGHVQNFASIWLPEQILRAIKALYTNTNAKVLTSYGETEQFDLLAGVLQGDTLAPFLLSYFLITSLEFHSTQTKLLDYYSVQDRVPDDQHSI